MLNNSLSNITHVDFTSGFNPSITSIGDLKNTPGVDQLKPLGKVPKKALSPDLVKGIQGGISILGSVAGKAIAGGKQTDSGIGNILSTAGGIAGTVLPGWLGAGVSAGLNLIGGGINALWGYEKNDEAIAELDAKLEEANNKRFNASNVNDLISQSNFSLVNSVNDELGEDGVFSHKIKDLEKAYNNKIGLANKQLLTNFNRASEQLDERNDKNMLANYTAYGGPLTMRYTGLMSPFGNRFDLGGNMPHSNGGVFSNGLMEINEGGTHEQNPYEGVPMGVDPQGVPNLVEEGETIFNDYVFSNRLIVPKSVRTKYKLRGNKKMTFAEASKKLAKESEERPNDPISKAGLNKSMEALQLEQEEVKQLEEAKENILNGMQSIVGNKFAKGGTTDRRKNYNAFKEWFSSIYPNSQVPSQQEFDSYDDAHDYIKLYMSSFWDDTKLNAAVTTGKRTPYKLNIYNSKNKKIGTIEGVKGIADFYRKMNLLGEDIALADSKIHYTQKDKSGERIYSYTHNPTTKYAILDTSGNPIYFDNKEQLPKGYTVLDKTDYDGTNTETLYYKQPKVKTSGKGTDITNLRYLPAVTSGINVLTDALGWTNKEDYSNANAITDSVRNIGYRPVFTTGLSNYLSYNPFDINYQANKLAAQDAATRRAIINQSAGNRSTALAGLLSAGYNSQTKLGEALREAELYNLEQRQKVEGFNRDINQFNADQALKAAMANQAVLTGYRTDMLNATTAASKFRNEIDEALNKNRSANINNFTQTLANIGNEEVAWNQLKWATEHNVFSPMREAINKNFSNKQKRGGKLLTKKKYGI